MAPVLRLGIVGGNATRAWAHDAHLPALRRLPQFAITAVSARTQDLAEAARVAFGAERAFGDSLALVQDPDIEVVAVTVKVPEHRAIVLAALAAGKHVYCEWPLGRDLAEAREIAAAVTPASHVMIGLQALSSPAVRHAARLVREGLLGKLKLCRVLSPMAGWGNQAPPHFAYLQDKLNGATLETIGGGHTLAAIEAVVGRYVEVDARTSILQPTVQIMGTQDSVTRTCADHMLVLGRHDSGCVSTLEVTGADCEHGFRFELIGEKATIKLTSTNPRGFQTGTIHVEASVVAAPEPDLAIAGLVAAPVNVSEAYLRLAADIAADTRTVPDFDDAVRLASLLEAIDDASTQGIRQQV
ncbi:Gfo/Idh/MocA family oxidoreductase [Sphingobium sp.]|uniref:Gfo/Idh/MocA family oxidoreductase n=1 Tax=Sphingobium sp. TaxID=1912891 RepID=UPI003BB61D7E